MSGGRRSSGLDRERGGVRIDDREVEASVPNITHHDLRANLVDEKLILEKGWIGVSISPSPARCFVPTCFPFPESHDLLVKGKSDSPSVVAHKPQ